MITNDGRYWATGIDLRCDGERWGGQIDFYDDGFADDDPDTGSVATQGKLQTRYMVRDGAQVPALRAVLDTLIADAERLGIRFAAPGGITPSLYCDDPDSLSIEQKWLIADEAARLGWECPYTRPTMAWLTIDDDGRITDGSTITVGEWTWPIPERTSNGWRMAPARIGEALAQRGWRMIRDVGDDRSRPGLLGIPVERIEED